MNLLIVGSGGREHAIAWKAAQSPLLTRLWIAPGNPGTAEIGENLPVSSADHASLVNLALQRSVDLVIIGPEQPLAEGLADAFLAAGIKVFGPTRAAAQIEASKVFAKRFMARHAIPTARFAIPEDYTQAVELLHTLDYPLVIKASGLAAGKGVILPDTIEEAEAALRAILVESQFGSAGSQVILEERLQGEEVSVLAFTDGIRVVPMLPSQDHKRLLDGDRGPNTGGMGAYAPAAVCDAAALDRIVAEVLEPTVRGLHSEGSPFCGVLYAGMMLTSQGPRVLEFNCRFGDPETQALLPLMDSDLVEIALACAEERLEPDMVRWKKGSAVCIVLASKGYPDRPDTGIAVEGITPDSPPPQTALFHAGTIRQDGRLLTSGGRVLGVTAWDVDLPAALDRAYDRVGQIRFAGLQYRKDIGRRALANLTSTAQAGSAYSRSGVDIDAGSRAVELMSQAVRSTYTPRVLAGIGAFGGLLDISDLKAYSCPVLVASTDGVGTKVKLAAAAGSYHSIGKDIVNHCIDDILVQGARPLFFLDYFASSRIHPEHVAQVVGGIAEACRESSCVLIGGETAEMPGVYNPGEFDVAGTIVGVVEKERILPRPDLSEGDLILGLASSGPHTNGYSLIRRVFAGEDLNRELPELGGSLVQALLQPHRSYLPILAPVLDGEAGLIKALVHLTGGGFIDNIPRVLPGHLDAVIEMESWSVPPLFRLIQQRGQIDPLEMYRVFNMGLGMLVIAAPQDVDPLLRLLPEPACLIGRLTPGSGQVRLV